MLTSEQRSAFLRDGFLVYGPLLGPDEVAALGDRLDRLARSGSPALRSRRLEGFVKDVAGDAEPTSVAQMISPVEADGDVRSVAGDQRILPLVADLLGSDDVRLLGNQALMKPAHHGSAVSWHQDSGYWPGFRHDVDPAPIVTCWLAVDEVTEDNGCVRMVPGSHRRGPLPHRADPTDGMRHVEGVDVGAAVPVLLPPGGVSFHHSCTVHGSGPNRTPHRRRGLALHYARGDVGWVDASPRPELPPVVSG